MASRTHIATITDTLGDPLAVTGVTLYVVRDSDSVEVLGSLASPVAATETGSGTGVWEIASGDIYAQGESYSEHWLVTFVNSATQSFVLNFEIAGAGGGGPTLDLCPITLVQLKDHLRVDDAAEDAHVTALAVAACQWVEDHCNRFMLSRAVVMRRTGFPGAAYWSSSQHWPDDDDDRDAEEGNTIHLPRGPVTALVSIVYTNTAGTPVTLDPSRYRLVPSSDTRPFAMIQLSAAAMAEGGWPTDCDHQLLDGVVITYTAGYGASASAVPQPMIHAIKMLAAEWYRLREGVAGGQITGAEAPHGVTNLLATQRFPTV